jgi:hypothetical protein
MSPATRRLRSHRVIVWSLIVLASLLLVVSMTANWVQRTALDTNEVTDMTDQIVADDDVQKALSIYLVDQLYATVDVKTEIENALPSQAKALAAPVAAASRQLALDISEKALASPRFQSLVSATIRASHHQFVKLIRERDKYISTNGEDVTLDYGSLVAELATRLGVPPDTITELQGIVRKASTELKEGLTKAQSQIKSVRAELSKVQGGTLDPQTRQTLQTLNQTAAELQTKLADLDKTVQTAQDKAPSQLQDRLGKFDGRLSNLDERLNKVEDRTAAVLEDPSQANVDDLDALLTAAEERVTALLGRPIVQSPGQLVLIQSDQLSGIQGAVRALRNLGIVLPLLVFAMYIGAIFLAGGWRREALIAAGGGMLVSLLVVLLVRRLSGHAVVDSLAGSETVKPAVQSVWDIVSSGLRERALFLLVIGLAFVGGGVLAGPSRAAVASRRFLAPYLRDHPVGVYLVVATVFLLWLTFIPGIENIGQIIVIVGLAALAVFGIEVLRRQTAQEFPPS